MKIFFSVGEPSGDLHGANLIRRLRQSQPDVEAVGYGGPRMARAGCVLHEDLTTLAIMWFGRVLLNIHKFWNLLCRADRYFRHHRPDAVVLIDYPGFNWWIARRAKAHGIPVFYYGAPQLWAWASWRVKKMRRLIDHVLCKLPFEEPWFRERGCNATYVGHPYFDQLSEQTLDRQFLGEQTKPDGPLVTILPGSRSQEVASNLHWFLKAAGIVHREVPTARFAIASFSEKHATAARAAARESGLPVEVFVGRTQELIVAGDCAMACSGSVSLELLYYTTPAVVLYWITRFAYRVQTFFRRVRYITLVNLLAVDDLCPGGDIRFDPDAPGAEDVPFPEYLTSEDKSENMAAHVVRWLTDAGEHRKRVEMLERVKADVVREGASVAAARYILQELAGRPERVLRPHFVPESTAASDGQEREMRRAG